MTLKREIAEFIAIHKLRYGRGSELLGIGETTFKRIIYLGAGWLLFKEWFGWEIPKWIAIGIGIGYIILCDYIGGLDLRIGFWKIENRISSKIINPYFEEKFKEVCDKIDKIDKNEK